jgi:hypothetical protein
METVKISEDDRFILIKLTVEHEPNITPFYMLNLYAPAYNLHVHINFYNKLMAFFKGT